MKAANAKRARDTAIERLRHLDDKLIDELYRRGAFVAGGDGFGSGGSGRRGGSGPGDPTASAR